MRADRAAIPAHAQHPHMLLSAAQARQPQPLLSWLQSKCHPQRRQVTRPSTVTRSCCASRTRPHRSGRSPGGLRDSPLGPFRRPLPPSLRATRRPAHCAGARVTPVDPDPLSRFFHREVLAVACRLAVVSGSRKRASRKMAPAAPASVSSAPRSQSGACASRLGR